ncbi:Predicted pyridoxine biosynthesis protein (probably from glycolaldehide) [hydrothermal vent metagenome]|uniref:3-oxo-tetronate kinase n=1 Tax=hydrothermal vent metagenome TaxID=652676 RepID=A0A3B0RX47_9ZZZZ
MPKPRQLILGCIADDHTGATDIAGLLARSGVPVSLRMGVPECDPAHADVAAIEVIALKSRNLPVAEAVAQARAAYTWLKAAGAGRFYWKYCSTFDSTATGNIGPMAEALMADMGADQTIYCPAFPENGRSVFMGHLFVGGQPLAESPMKDHPLTPMRDSNLMRLLSPQVRGKTGLANRVCVARGTQALHHRLEELRKDGMQHVITDAVCDEDLQTIARACHAMPLLTGGSALAMHLPGLYRKAGLISDEITAPPPPVLPRGSLVLSGSCSAMTQAQVAAYLKSAKGYRLDPLEITKAGLQPALDWLAAQPTDSAKIIYATAPPDQVRAAQQALGAGAASALIEDALARLAQEARALGTRRFVVAGGETSGAITKALGIRQMTIGREITPGVPWTYCTSGGHTLALALKSGNFGEVDFFTRALHQPESP